VHINPGTHPDCGKKHLEAIESGHCYPIEKPKDEEEETTGKKRN
jgi:hypothetical protein